MDAQLFGSFGRDRKTLGNGIAPQFQRRASNRDYWLIGGVSGRMTVVLTEGGTAAGPVAAVVPLDVNFDKRVEAMLRLWPVLDGKTELAPQDRFTALRRKYLRLKLRALDARLEGHSYRAIAQGLYGQGRVPKGQLGKPTNSYLTLGIWSRIE